MIILPPVRQEQTCNKEFFKSTDGLLIIVKNTYILCNNCILFYFREVVEPQNESIHSSNSCSTPDGFVFIQICLYIFFRGGGVIFNLKSLSPIDRKFHGLGKNDEFVLYEYIIKKCSSFYKYTNISVMEKCQIIYNMSTVNRKYVLFIGNIVSYLIVSDQFQVVNIHLRIEQFP